MAPTLKFRPAQGTFFEHQFLGQFVRIFPAELYGDHCCRNKVRLRGAGGGSVSLDGDLLPVYGVLRAPKPILYSMEHVYSYFYVDQFEESGTDRLYFHNRI